VASVTASYPQIFALAAAVVGVGGGVVWLYGRAAAWYHRSIGSRRDVARLFNQLGAGVTTRYVEERFGAPAFVRKSGNLLSAMLPVPLLEQVYRTKHAWLQVLSDEDGAVVRFSIMVTDPRFRFDVAVLTGGQLQARLGHSRFSQVGSQLGPDGRSLWIGARRRGYSESYWFGNPGNYQRFVLSHNDVGAGGFGFSAELQGVGWHQDGFLKFAAQPREGLPEFDPVAPYAREFRALTTVNTLTVLGPHYDPAGLDQPPGLDGDYVRVLVPDARGRRQIRRRVRRMGRQLERKISQEPASLPEEHAPSP
jgi:hypothetical protein